MGLKLTYQEGQTPLDEDEKEGLKIKTITTQGELNEFEQLNIENAMQWLLSTKIKPTTVLTEKFIKKLHLKMYGDVWKWAGTFRKTNKNIGVDWVQINLQLKQLLDDTQYWVANKTYNADEIAIRFKHRLVAIHCFPNGNGRHSRIMADIIMETIFKKDIFTWHRSNMVKADAVRKEYIIALRKADNGNIMPLIKFAKK
jgi:Fic-DOC domain mobile mystery protein B